MMQVTSVLSLLYSILISNEVYDNRQQILIHLLDEIRSNNCKNITFVPTAELPLATQWWYLSGNLFHPDKVKCREFEIDVEGREKSRCWRIGHQWREVHVDLARRSVNDENTSFCRGFNAAFYWIGDNIGTLCS